MAASKAKAETKAKSSASIASLREWLITAQLPPGEFLSEAVLAEQCKTSRTPVREACSRLAQDKWLSLIPRKGYLVKPISVRDIVELYEFRKVLECFSAEKVAQAATPEQVAQLKTIVAVERNSRARCRQDPGGQRSLSPAPGGNGGQSARASTSSALALGYVRRLDTLCTQTVPGWIGHKDIIRAIEARKPGEARKAMATHIDLSLEKMIRLFSA